MSRDDRRLFAGGELPKLRHAVADLSWLLTRGYAMPSALKLVGDRHQLHKRQRDAVARCACSDQSRAWRLRHRMTPEAVRGQRLSIDGYNVLTVVATARRGGVVLQGRDECLRDLTGAHGRARDRQSDLEAAGDVGSVLHGLGLGADWVLDRAVSGSERLARGLEELASERGWDDWAARLVPDADAALLAGERCAASADSRVLDGVTAWLDLGRRVIERRIPGAWVVRLQ